MVFELPWFHTGENSLEISIMPLISQERYSQVTSAAMEKAYCLLHGTGPVLPGDCPCRPWEAEGASRRIFLCDPCTSSRWKTRGARGPREGAGEWARGVGGAPQISTGHGPSALPLRQVESPKDQERITHYFSQLDEGPWSASLQWNLGLCPCS